MKYRIYNIKDIYHNKIVLDKEKSKKLRKTLLSIATTITLINLKGCTTNKIKIEDTKLSEILETYSNQTCLDEILSNNQIDIKVTSDIEEYIELATILHSFNLDKLDIKTYEFREYVDTGILNGIPEYSIEEIKTLIDQYNNLNNLNNTQINDLKNKLSYAELIVNHKLIGYYSYLETLSILITKAKILDALDLNENYLGNITIDSNYCIHLNIKGGNNGIYTFYISTEKAPTIRNSIEDVYEFQKRTYNCGKYDKNISYNEQRGNVFKTGINDMKIAISTETYIKDDSKHSTKNIYTGKQLKLKK